MGQVGRAVARRVRAFDTRLSYCDLEPLPVVEAAELGARRLTLAELLAASDVVVPLVPLTASTRHLLDEQALAGLRPGRSSSTPGGARSSMRKQSRERSIPGGWAVTRRTCSLSRTGAPGPAPRGPAAAAGTPPNRVHPAPGVGGGRRPAADGPGGSGQVRQALAGLRPGGAVNTISTSPAMRAGPGRSAGRTWRRWLPTWQSSKPAGFRAAAQRLGVTQGAVSTGAQAGNQVAPA